MTSRQNPVADQLSRFIQLEQQLRNSTTRAEFAFTLVNDCQFVCPCQKALFWDGADNRLTHCSGVSQIDPNVPFVRWLNGLCQRISTGDNAHQLKNLSATDFPEEATQWQNFLPPQLIWLPLLGRNNQLVGALLIAGDKPVNPASQPLMPLLQDAASHALVALHSSRRLPARRNRRQRRWMIAVALVVIAVVLALPVQQTVLAPAQIEAAHPSTLRAPVKGVVAQILVQPNDVVHAGQTLIELDTREIDSRLDASRQQLAIAAAELRQAQQQALYDNRSKAQLEVLKSRRDQAQAEVDYLQKMQARMTITAPQDGIAVFDDPSAWVGRPVDLGERIMQLASADDVRLAVNLPVEDAIALPTDARVRLFLNTAPTRPIAARLTRLAYRARANADGTLAYPLKADFASADPALELGLKGTAKLYGERTHLFFYLLRRPLATLRVWLAF